MTKQVTALQPSTAHECKVPQSQNENYPPFDEPSSRDQITTKWDNVDQEAECESTSTFSTSTTTDSLEDFCDTTKPTSTPNSNNSQILDTEQCKPPVLKINPVTALDHILENVLKTPQHPYVFKQALDKAGCIDIYDFLGLSSEDLHAVCCGLYDDSGTKVDDFVLSQLETLKSWFDQQDLSPTKASFQLSTELFSDYAANKSFTGIQTPESASPVQLKTYGEEPNKKKTMILLPTIISEDELSDDSSIESFSTPSTLVSTDPPNKCGDVLCHWHEEFTKKTCQTPTYHIDTPIDVIINKTDPTMHSVHHASQQYAVDPLDVRHIISQVCKSNALPSKFLLGNKGYPCHSTKNKKLRINYGETEPISRHTLTYGEHPTSTQLRHEYDFDIRELFKDKPTISSSF
jgi:hypothetical protein